MTTTTFNCPTCHKPVPEPTADMPIGHFPFCCERCRLIDLGRWLDGKYQIPAEESDDGASDEAEAKEF